jgi:hypothetical protein
MQVPANSRKMAPALHCTGVDYYSGCTAPAGLLQSYRFGASILYKWRCRVPRLSILECRTFLFRVISLFLALYRENTAGLLAACIAPSGVWSYGSNPALKPRYPVCEPHCCTIRAISDSSLLIEAGLRAPCGHSSLMKWLPNW